MFKFERKVFCDVFSYFFIIFFLHSKISEIFVTNC